FSKRVSASAVPPAKPASTLPWKSRRTFRAPRFTTVWPRLTCPSPAITTLPRCRTQRIVVPCITASSLRAGVCAIVGLHQMVEVHVRVALRRGEARMSEELLDRAQIGALIEKMSGERVTDRVRARGDRRAGAGDVTLDEASDAPCGEAAAAVI